MSLHWSRAEHPLRGRLPTLPATPPRDRRDRVRQPTVDYLSVALVGGQCGVRFLAAGSKGGVLHVDRL